MVRAIVANLVRVSRVKNPYVNPSALRLTKETRVLFVSRSVPWSIRRTRVWAVQRNARMLSAPQLISLISLRGSVTVDHNIQLEVRMKLICQNSQHGYVPAIAHIASDICVRAVPQKNQHSLEMVGNSPPQYKLIKPRKLAVNVDSGDAVSFAMQLKQMQDKFGYLDDLYAIELHGSNYEGMVQLINALKLMVKTCNITYYCKGELPQEQPLSAILNTGAGVIIQTTGLPKESPFSQDVTSLLDRYLFVGGSVQIDCLDCTSRPDLMNYYFGLFCKDVPLIAYRSPTVATDDSVIMNDPLAAMVRIYDECRIGIGDNFVDFQSLLSRMQFRYLYQMYDILNSYSRFEEAFLPTVTYTDLDGSIYLSSTFLSESICGTIWDTSLESRKAPPPEKFFATNAALRNRCRGCPILPLCFGGDPWIAEDQQEKDCLQKFCHYAPIWTYLMNGHFLYSPIWDVVEAGFKHRELYQQFLNSDVYKNAVGKK